MVRALIATLLLSITVVAAAPAALPGDANCDGRRDSADIAALIANLFGPVTCSDADVNGDGVVSAADLPALLRRLGGPPANGPVVTFFGLASAAGDPTQPIATTEDGVSIFQRPVGVGFKLVVEGTAGSNGNAVGRTVEPLIGRPDLQIESEHALGNGSFDRCPGTVPPIDPADFGAGTSIDQALRAFACGFLVSTSRVTACTLNQFGNPDWIGGATQAQFCLQVEALRQFPRGQTLLTAQLLDGDGQAGPLQRIIVQVGTAPTATHTATRTPTPIATETPTATRTATITATLPASRTPTRSATTTASATLTTSNSPTPTVTGTIATASPSRTPASATVTRTATPSGTLTATASRTPITSNTPTRTGTTAPPTATRTVTPPPTSTATLTSTNALPVTRTPTFSPSPQFTVTRTPTRTRTLTPSATATAIAGSGPVVTFFGVVNADDSVMPPSDITTDGIPIYRRRLGFGFSVVVEGRPGASRRPVGMSAFAPDPSDPTVRPDLQIQVTQPLGNGSPEVCDNSLPVIGGVPAVNPPNFEVTQTISDRLNDLGCRFLTGDGVPGSRGSADACTVFSDGVPRFVNRASTTQYCGQIARRFGFAAGDTVVTVQLRDSVGNLGPLAQIIVRIVPLGA